MEGLRIRPAKRVPTTLKPSYDPMFLTSRKIAIPASTIREGKENIPRRVRKIQWIHKLLERLPTVKIKARRFLAAVFVAFSIWLSGLSFSVPPSAHAAAPISVKFTGVEVVARAPEWNSFGQMDASSNQETMTLAMQKRQAFMSSQPRKQGEAVTALGNRAISMATAAGIMTVVALPTGAGIVITRNKSSTASMNADIEEETSPESDLSPQNEMALDPPEEINDQGSRLSQIAEETKTKSGTMASDLTFLALCGLSVFATFSIYKPE